MYRIRDRGLLRPDSALEIVDRMEGDTQIKLRGLRIELQDVEQPILTQPRDRSRWW
jgi:hybrid polyketide synthase / nonribosomal peptide synthetase ACE1